MYWQATVWTVWQLVLVLVATFALVRWRGLGWGTFLWAMLILFAGGLLQWFYAAAVPNVPVWQRLANLVAYPLVAVAVYQGTVADLQTHSRDLQDISQASLDQMKSLLNLFETSRQTSQSLDLSTVLDHAVRGFARVLNADQCAIVFPEESESGAMRLVAIYNPTRQGRGEAVTFPVEYQLTVQQAIRRRKPIIVEGTDNVQLKMLFALLGSGETGPLMVQPLFDHKGAIGAMIAGNSRSRRSFTANEAKLGQSMAEQVVAAIRNAQLYQVARAEIERANRAESDARRGQLQVNAQIHELTDRLAEALAENQEFKVREAAVREARNALETRLVSSRAEVETLSNRLVVLETDLAQTHANAEAQSRWHGEELARLRAQLEDTAGTADSGQAILQSMTAGVLVTDGHGVIQQANLAAEVILDRSLEELQGLTLVEIHADDSWRQAVATARGGKAVRVMLQVGVHTLLCELASFPDRGAAPHDMPRLIVIIQDVSAEIKEQRSRLEAVGSLAEEMRTPLTAITNDTGLLLAETVGILGNAQRKFLTRIRASAERLTQLTDSLTHEPGDDEYWTAPRRQLVDVNELIEASVAESESQLEARALTLELNLPDDLPTIKADPDRLRQALSTLVLNACLASSAGGQIRVQAMQSSTSYVNQDEPALNGDGFVVVSVQDSGGGLSDEAIDRVFDQARPSQTPSGLGESGAGLALIKTLVEADGGFLRVESEEGVGTTFSLVLPVNNVGEYGKR
jgi:signal transduction histidine kinase